MSFTKSIVLLSLFLSAVSPISAVASLHIARNMHHHRALAARAAGTAAVDVPFVASTLRKRASGKRCKSRHTSSSVPAAAPTSQPVVNVAPTPSVSAPLAKASPPPPKEIKSPQASPSPPPQESPKTTSKAQPAKTTPPAPKPSENKGSSSNLPSFLIGVQTGQGTFYDTGLGACGITNNDSDFIAAVSHLLFDSFPEYNGVNPNSNPICNRKVRATYKGKSVTVAITDRCTGCALTDLDFSPKAFNQLADFSVGRISGMTWEWL